MVKNDFSNLESMTYSGRAITVGITPNGDYFIGYTITGRSPSSQARKLVYEGKVIRTEVTNRDLLEQGNPALLLYPALVSANNMLIASNGAQTKLIYSEVRNNPNCLEPELILKNAHKPSWEYDNNEEWIDISKSEPDAPHYTPRISACLKGEEAGLYLVKLVGYEYVKIHCTILLKKGEGRLMTTYLGGNESPLEPATGAFYPMGVNSNDANQIADDLYEAIQGGAKPQDNYHVAAAVMMQKENNIEVVIRNRSELGD